MKSKFLFPLILSLLQGCGSYLTIHPRGCSTKVIFMEFDPTLYVYRKQFEHFNGKHELRGKVDFIIDQSIHTPLGMFVDHRIYLDDILEENDLHCDDISEVAYSFQNKAYDNLLSMIPFLSHKSVIVYGRLRRDPKGDGKKKILLPDVKDVEGLE